MTEDVSSKRCDIGRLPRLYRLPQLGLVLAIVVSLLPALTETAHGVYFYQRVVEPDLRTGKLPTNVALHLTYRITELYENDDLSGEIEYLESLLRAPRLRPAGSVGDGAYVRDVPINVTLEREYIESELGDEAIVTVTIRPLSPLAPNTNYALWEHIDSTSIHFDTEDPSDPYYISQTFRTAAGSDETPPQFDAGQQIEIALVYEPTSASGQTDLVVQLSWPRAVDESQFQYYVYRDSRPPDIKPSHVPRRMTEFVLGCTMFESDEFPISYRVQAVDIVGNRSELYAETTISCPRESVVTEQEAELAIVANANRIVGVRNLGEPSEIYSEKDDPRRVRSSRDGCNVSGHGQGGIGGAWLLFAAYLISRWRRIRRRLLARLPSLAGKGSRRNNFPFSGVVSPKARRLMPALTALALPMVGVGVGVAVGVGAGAGCGDNLAPPGPEGTVLFPPADGTIAYGDSILMRGIVRNDTPIAVVHVNGIAADSREQNGVTTWQVRVPLTSGDNRIVVSAQESGQSSSYDIATRQISAQLAPVLLNYQTPFIVDEARGHGFILLNPRDYQRSFQSDSALDIASSLIHIDLATGSFRPVNNARLTGFNIGDMFYDKDSARLLLLLESHRGQGLQLLWYDTATSNFSHGPELSGNLNQYDQIIADFARERFLFIGTTGIFTADFATGTRSRVAPYIDGYIYDGPDSRSLLALDHETGVIYLCDIFEEQLMSLDPDTATWEIVSESRYHSGPALLEDLPQHMLIDSKRRQAILHSGRSSASSPKVITVDLDSGHRDYFADAFTRDIAKIAIDRDSGRIWLVDRTLGSVWRESDDGTFANSIATDPDGEPLLYGGDSMVWDRSSSTAYVGRSSDGALFAVHIGASVTTEPIDLGVQVSPRILNITAQAIDTDGHTLWLQDNERRTIFAFDIESRERHPFTSSQVGEGSLLGTMGNIVYDSRRQRLLVLEAQRLMAVDRATGDRSVVVELPREVAYGDEPIVMMATPGALYLDEKSYRAVISYPASNLVLFIDLRTGEYSALRNVVPHLFITPEDSVDYGYGSPVVIRPVPKMLNDILDDILDDTLNDTTTGTTNSTTGDGARLLLQSELGLFAIEERTGVRQLLSGCNPRIEHCIGKGPVLVDANAMELVTVQAGQEPFALVHDHYWNALLAIDLTTGERVVIAR